MSLAVLAALLLAGAEPPPEARALKEAGDRHRAAGEAGAAREAYQAAVAAAGGWAEAREALGEVLLGERRYAEAAREFELAAEADPDLALAWYNLGYAARRAGDLGRARDAWRRYLALRPGDLDARLGLAEALRGLGEREGALEAYQAFAALAEPVPEEAGRLEKAREAMAALRAEAGAPAAAASGPLAPGEGQPGSAEAGRGDGRAAAVVPSGPVPGGAGQPGSPQAARGEGPAAVPGAAPAVIVVPVPAALPPPSPPAETQRSGRQAAAQQKLRLGDRLLAEGDTRLALFAFQDAVNQDPRSAEARLKLGRVYLKLEHLAEALEQFTVAAALDPSDVQVRQALEEAQARQEGRAPAAGPPIIVRLPAGATLEPAQEAPAAGPPPVPPPSGPAPAGTP